MNDAEPYRTEPVRVRLGARSEDTALTGYRSDAQLMRVVDETRGAVAMPAHGVVLSSLLARSLGARVGDRIELEFRLWNRQRVEVPVVDIVHTMFGKLLYMNLDAMNALARDGHGAAATPRCRWTRWRWTPSWARGEGSAQ